MRAEESLDSHHLSLVTERSARAVRIDVLDIGGVQFRILQGNLHCLACASALIIRCCNVNCIARHAKAQELGIDARSACLRMLEFFHDNDSRAFGKYESIAIAIEWSTRTGGIIVARTEGLHCRETANAERSHCAFAATGHHHVGIATLDDVEGCADSVTSSGAGSRGSDICALKPKANTHISSQCVHHKFGNHERTDRARTAIKELSQAHLDGVDAADS